MKNTAVRARSKKRNNKRNKNRRSRAISRIIKLVAIIPIVLLVALLFFKTSAEGHDDIRETKSDYYHELEGRYLEVLKAELSRKGMGSAGITMTSVIDINGDRCYKVQLHHAKINKMDELAKTEFLEYMATIDFSDGETEVIYEIL